MVFKKKKKKVEVEDEEEEQEEPEEEEEQEEEVEEKPKKKVPQAPSVKKEEFETFVVARIQSPTDPYKNIDVIVNQETEEAENLKQSICSLKNEVRKIYKILNEG